MYPKVTDVNNTVTSLFVIAGLDPAIHAELRFTMDHRVKPGGDD
jgi:hypothetical protein